MTAVAARVRRTSRSGGGRRWGDLLLSVASVVTLLSLWELAASSGVVNPLFTSAPSRILATLARVTANGTLWEDLWVSAQEFGLGLGGAIVIGIPLGMLIGWYRPVSALLGPYVTFLYTTPRVALLPLLIIWVGIGINLKVSIVFLGAVFAILITTSAGMRSLDRTLVNMSRSFCATDFAIFRDIALPGSVPFILSGVRLGIGHALTGVVVGELYASTAGVGHMIAVAGNTFQTDLVYVGIMITAIVGLLLFWVASRIERHFEAWRPRQRD